MVILAIISLVLGVVCGRFFFSDLTVNIFKVIADYALYITMLSVGISLGLNSAVFSKIRQYHFKILIIPAGIVSGSLLGGAICSIILKEPLYTSLAIASGMGWYSLAGVIVTDLAGPEMGTIAFLSNLMREIISYILIPIIALHLNGYSAIAPAGATSTDTSLPILMKHTDKDVIIMAVVNGLLCSALVPVLINLFLNI